MTSAQLSSLLLPAAVGAVGGGALSAHLTSKTNRRNEDPAMKRKRVMRNALAGAAMGAGAGALIPGSQMLVNGYQGAKPGLLSSAADKTLGGLTGNAAGLGVAGAGSYGVWKHNQGAKGKAMQVLADKLFGETKGLAGASEELSKARLARLVEHSATGGGLSQTVSEHLQDLKGVEKAPDNVLRKGYELNDLLHASGNQRVGLREILGTLNGTPADKLHTLDPAMAKSLQSYLGGEGPVSRQVAGLLEHPKHLPFADKLPGAISKHLPSPLRVAEEYHKRINPVGWRMAGRIPTIAAALGIVPAALIANRLQKQVTGQ